MKIVKIIVSTRGGEHNYYITISDTDNLDSVAEEWCEEHDKQSCYGWSYTWDLLSDEKEIAEVLTDKIKIANNKIANLIEHKTELENYLKTMKNE